MIFHSSIFVQALGLFSWGHTKEGYPHYLWTSYAERILCRHSWITLTLTAWQPSSCIKKIFLVLQVLSVDWMRCRSTVPHIRIPAWFGLVSGSNWITWRMSYGLGHQQSNRSLHLSQKGIKSFLLQEALKMASILWSESGNKTGQESD